MKNIAALMLLTCGLFAWSPPADACMRHEPFPDVVEPIFVGDSPTAALVKPLRLTKFERHGLRYWRAAYEIIEHREGVPVNLELSRVVIVEWACDPFDGGTDVCGARATDVLPGFDEQGGAQAGHLQLHLESIRLSSFDGAPVFVARA